MKKLSIPWPLILVLLALALVFAGGINAATNASAATEQAPPVPVTAGQRPHAPAATLVVTSTADAGPGTLRQALEDATSGDTITFHPDVFPPGMPVAIFLNSQLPDISVGNLTLDATNAVVGVLGMGLATGDGLRIVSDGNVVAGMGFAQFPGNGLVISNGANNIIGGSNATPGGACTGDCNAFGNNGLDGVLIEGSGSTGNVVSGNYIGLAADGTIVVGNAVNGITIRGGAHHNTVGGDTAGERNVISANGASGVRLDQVGTSGNVVVGNYIGTDASGTLAIGNAQPGVAVVGGATQNWIGGTASGEGNVISGNNHNGIQISNSGTISNTVVGNYVGTDAAGTAAVGNSGSGVVISDASRNRIGGPSAAERNIITYNRYGGVNLSTGATENVVQGNWIGVDDDGTRDVGVTHIAYSPAYASDGTIFVGTEGQGVFKTADGGAHWSEMNSGLADLVIDALALSPDYGSDQTLYVGTPSGVFKSTTGGASWVSAGPAEYGQNVLDLALSPDYGSDQTLLMGNISFWDSEAESAVGGVWLSTDRGVTWEDLTPAAGLPVAGDANATIAREGMPPLPVGVWLAQEPARPAGIAQEEGHIDGLAVAFSPDFATDHTLFVGTQGSSRSLFKSTDGGASWVPVDAGLDGSDVRHIAVSPGYLADRTLFAMDDEQDAGHPFRSTNGGASWTELTAGLPADDSQPLGFALSPAFATDGTVFASFGFGTWGVRGFFRSLDGGGTWFEASPGIQNQRSVGAVAVSPDYASDGELLLSARWNGLLASYDEGDNWAYANGDLTDPGNGGGGIAIFPGAHENVIGGAAPGEGNLISNNGGEGIGVQGPGYGANEILGNRIGTDASGTSTLGNAGAGVMIFGGSAENIIGADEAPRGTACSGACNLVSGNGDDGISVDGWGSDYNIIRGNFVGTDVTGSYALPNLDEGITLWDGPVDNWIENNLVSGNRRSGIALSDGTESTTITGNYIGVDASGTFSLPNEYCGVLLQRAATGNVIGGDTPDERNIISGNLVDGIGLWSGDAGDNAIQGNYIGADASGTSAIGNGLRGIAIMSGKNIVGGQNASPGGACSGECNLISGSTYGLQIFLNDAVSNTVTGNHIGTDASGMSLLPHRYEAVFLGSWAADNRLGGTTPAERNLIAGMVQIGPDFRAPLDNEVLGNYIGLDATGTTCVAQPYHGIALGGQYTTIEGNRICGAEHDGISIYNGGNLVVSNEVFGHGEAGIRVSGSEALTNTLSHNSIYDNGGLGIDLVDGGNTDLPAPVIEAYDLGAGTASGTACAHCAVELFSDAHGEGRWFEASTMADAGGHWVSAKGSAFLGPELTATATDLAGNTSEFGQDWPPDPPSAPTIAFPLCGVTNQPAPQFLGHAQAGSTVRLGAGGLALGETTTDDWNRWSLRSEAYLSEASHVITATATTAYGASGEATLALVVDSSLCFDPVGVTFAQLGHTQHPQNAAGCVDPEDALEIDLWPDEPVLVQVPARVTTATVYIEVNAIRHDLYDPDGDKVFTGSFVPPSSGNVVILVVADCDSDPGFDVIQIGSVIDPDGYVYDGFLAAAQEVTQTIEGVTVTLYLSDTVRAKWIAWDAELYDQINPQVTGPDGYFSFFTPPGGYKLVADGQPLGYELYESPLLTVVSEPVRYNVGLWPPLERIYLPVVLRKH